MPLIGSSIIGSSIIGSSIIGSSIYDSYTSSNTNRIPVKLNIQNTEQDSLIMELLHELINDKHK
jgi:hypothetical protein